MKQLGFVLILLAARAAYSEERIAVIPDLPSANLELNWADLKLLLEKIQPEPDKTKELAPPPIPWFVNAAMFVADATETHSVRVEAEYQIYLWAEEWNKIPLFGAEVALESATLGDTPVFPFMENEKFVLLLNQPGPHVFKAVFRVPITKKDTEMSFGFSCTRSSVSRMTLRLGAPDMVVGASTAADIRVKKTETGKVADLIFHSSDRIAVTWKPAPKPLPPPEPPLIACQKSTLATVSERLVACQSLLQYNILRSEAKQFRLRFPAEARITRVEADGGEWTSKEEGDAQLVTVVLKHPVKGHYNIALDYEISLSESAVSVVLPYLEALDMARQSGYLAVATRGSLETTIGAPPTGVRQIDANDLPAALRMLSLDPILHAFSVNENAATLVLSLRRLEEAPVQVAVIDDARYESVITEQGLMLTRAAYVVRNNLKKFLRVELEPDVEVWSASVSGREVRPAREDGDSASNVILIPLAKSNETGRRVNAFPVELFYFKRLSPSARWIDTLSLEAPITDVVAKSVAWKVLLPESWQVYRCAGDFTPAKRLTPVSLAPAAQYHKFQGTASTSAPDADTEILRRLREDRDKLLPQKGVPVSGEPRQPAVTVVGGVQPVQMELPQVGKSHYFERILVPENTSLNMVLHIYNSRLQTLLNRALRIIALLCGFLATGYLLKNFTRHAQVNAFIVFAAAAVILRYAGMSLFAFTGWMLLGAILAGIAQWRRGSTLISEQS